MNAPKAPSTIGYSARRAGGTPIIPAAANENAAGPKAPPYNALTATEAEGTPYVVQTRRGVTHILDRTEVAGRGVPVAFMVCGDVLAPEILTYVQDEPHPFSWCRRCRKWSTPC